MLGQPKSYNNVTFSFIVQSAQKTRFIWLDTLCKNNYNAKSLRNTKGRAACAYKSTGSESGKIFPPGQSFERYSAVQIQSICTEVQHGQYYGSSAKKEIKMINESISSPFKRVTRLMATTVIVFLLIVGIFATSAFAGIASQYNVVINDNGRQFTVATEETEPIEILNEANLTLGEFDRLDISGFTAGEGGVITVDRLNTVNIQLGDVITPYEVYADTVGDALKEIGVENESKALNYEDTDAVENGMVIMISAPYEVTVYADGETYDISISDSTVEDVISLAGISLGSEDYTEPQLSEAVTDGMQITVYRVETKIVTETETIKHDTKTKTDSSMEIGKSRTETKGSDGEKTVTYEVKYVNGEEQSRNEISSVVTKEPVTEVKYVGTKAADVKPNGVQSKNGYTLGQKIKGKYTHYCACAKCCGKSNGVTASGKKVYNGMPDPHYVACNWLPLGSVIQVDGVNYTVVDRGGSRLSKTGRIDIYTPGGHSAALKGGTGSCDIVIVRLGW